VQFLQRYIRYANSRSWDLEAERAATASRSPSPDGRLARSHAHTHTLTHALLLPPGTSSSAAAAAGKERGRGGYVDTSAARAALEESTAVLADDGEAAGTSADMQHGGITVDKDAVIAAHKTVLIAVSRLLLGHPSVLRYFCELSGADDLFSVCQRMHAADASVAAVADAAMAEIAVARGDHDRQQMYLKAQRKQQMHSDDSLVKVSQVLGLVTTISPAPLPHTHRTRN